VKSKNAEILAVFRVFLAKQNSKKIVLSPWISSRTGLIRGSEIFMMNIKKFIGASLAIFLTLCHVSNVNIPAKTLSTQKETDKNREKSVKNNLLLFGATGLTTVIIALLVLNSRSKQEDVPECHIHNNYDETLEKIKNNELTNKIFEYFQKFENEITFYDLKTLDFDIKSKIISKFLENSPIEPFDGKFISNEKKEICCKFVSRYVKLIEEHNECFHQNKKEIETVIDEIFNNRMPLLNNKRVEEISKFGFNKDEVNWIKFLAGGESGKLSDGSEFRYKSYLDFYYDSQKETHSIKYHPLEAHHNYIQILFPARDKSGVTNKDFYLDKKIKNWENFLKTNLDIYAAIKTHLMANLLHMLKFWKFNVTIENGTLISIKPTNNQVFGSPTDHNNLRITRVMHSLRLFGLHNEHELLLKALETGYPKHRSMDRFWSKTRDTEPIVSEIAEDVKFLNYFEKSEDRF